MTTKALTEDIPTSRAWVTGRRIYVRSSYRSALSEALREAGATWDRDERCWWVGTGKREIALSLIAQHAERVAEIVGRKSEAHWVTIPFDAVSIRAKAKMLGALWDRERKQWGLPTAEAAAEVSSAVASWEAERSAARSRPAARVPSSGTCDECGRRGARHQRYDSSGIAGVVCDRCSRSASYELSFA